MKNYRFPNIKTVEAVLSSGDPYKGYFNGKHFSINLSFLGYYVARVGDRSFSRDRLVDVMAELHNELRG